MEHGVALIAIPDSLCLMACDFQVAEVMGNQLQNEFNIQFNITQSWVAWLYGG